MERITRRHLDMRVENLNRRMENAGSIYRYEISARNGATHIDRTFQVDTVGAYVGHSHVYGGTKSEVGWFLHAMMVAIDDVNRKGEFR